MRPLLRIPYTDALPHPKIIPPTANTVAGAVAALVDFLSPAGATPSSASSSSSSSSSPSSTLLLTGAGISTPSGLADYRGSKGTYTLNRSYRPIYYHEFCANHEARKRYWARSFLGWTNLQHAKPNAAHRAVGRLGELGIVGEVVTQNVDSFHPLTHPSLPTIELHGALRTLHCLTCNSTYPRSSFQTDLARLNPVWNTFLQDLLASGALDTENPDERAAKGLRTNPDGDVDVGSAGVEYSTFRYPACPVCLSGGKERVSVDRDGAWAPPETAPTPSSPTPSAGILKPSVVMFGESIPASTKSAAEHAVDSCSRVLVVGSSLATYSAWRLVKKAREMGRPIGVLNIGGVRGEEGFFEGVEGGSEGVRCSVEAEVVLPEVVRVLEGGA